MNSRPHEEPLETPFALATRISTSPCQISSATFTTYSLRPYLPSFRHALVDLGPMDDGALSAEARLRAFLKALKYNRRSSLPACIDIILAEAPVLEEEDLFVILTYLDKGPLALDDKVMHETLLRLVPDRKERIMGWLTQPYYDKGLAEGEAKILFRLLEKRFGAIPAAFRERIFAAEPASIESWSERLLDAHDLQAVFDSN